MCSKGLDRAAAARHNNQMDIDTTFVGHATPAALRLGEQLVVWGRGDDTRRAREARRVLRSLEPIA